MGTLSVPYAGIKGEQILKKLKKTIESINANAEKKRKVRIVYTAKKLGTKFPVKDKTPKEHKSMRRNGYDCSTEHAFIYEECSGICGVLPNIREYDKSRIVEPARSAPWPTRSK